MATCRNLHIFPKNSHLRTLCCPGIFMQSVVCFLASNSYWICSTFGLDVALRTPPRKHPEFIDFLLDSVWMCLGSQIQGSECAWASFHPLISATVYAITGSYYDVIPPAVKEVMFNRNFVHKNKLNALKGNIHLKLVSRHKWKKTLINVKQGLDSKSNIVQAR